MRRKVKDVANLRSGSKQENHNQGMWKADLGTIDCAVARSLHDGEHIGISGIQYYIIESFL